MPQYSVRVVICGGLFDSIISRYADSLSLIRDSNNKAFRLSKLRLLNFDRYQQYLFEQSYSIDHSMQKKFNMVYFLTESLI